MAEIPTAEQMYAALQLAVTDEVFFNVCHWEEGREDEIVCILLLNDTFAYACADGEEIPWSEIESVAALYNDAPCYHEGRKALVRWARERRGYDPIAPILNWLDKPLDCDCATRPTPGGDDA